MLSMNIINIISIPINELQPKKVYLMRKLNAKGKEVGETTIYLIGIKVKKRGADLHVVYGNNPKQVIINNVSHKKCRFYPVSENEEKTYKQKAEKVVYKALPDPNIFNYLASLTEKQRIKEFKKMIRDDKGWRS